MATTNIQSFSGKIEVNGTTPSSSKITGALTVAGGVGIADALYGANANLEDVEADSVNITDSTPSSSKITGALKVAGGVGVSGALYGANANLEDVEADSVNITDSTASTSTTTGALTVTGGVGVASNIHTSNLFASDYVGIGTTSPRQKLEVANGSIAIVQNNYKSGADDDQFAGKIDFHLGVGVGELVTPVATIEAYDKWTGGGSYFGALAFKTMNSEKMRIHSNGYVGIGTPSPDAPLVVQVGGTDSTARTGLILRTPESADETGYNIDFYQSTALVSRIAALTESSGQIGMAFSTYNGSTAERMRIDANGNVGIGTGGPTRSLQIKRGISYISGGTSNNSAFEIVQQLGTDNYTYNGQHRAQFRINSGLGTYSNRSLELALLDNGRGVIQANAASEGYFPISINPAGDYFSTVSIGSYSSGAKLHVQGNVYTTSDLTTSARIGAGVYTSLSNKLQVAGTTASQKFNSYYHSTGIITGNQTYSLAVGQWTKAWDPAAGQGNQTILNGYYFVTVERRDGNQYERALGWMYVGGYPPTGVYVWSAGSFNTVGSLSISASNNELDIGNLGEPAFPGGYPTSYQIEITKISGYVSSNDYIG